jgi:hypothetical protein
LVIAFEPAQNIQRIRVRGQGFDFLLDVEKSSKYKYSNYTSSPPP